MSHVGDVRVEPLRSLAERHGILATYEDTSREVVQAEPEVLVAVLGALGVPIDSVDDAPRLLHQDVPAPPPIEPVVVLEPERASTVPLRGDLPGLGRWTLTDGDRFLEGTCGSHGCRLPPLPVGFWDLEIERSGDGEEPLRSRLLVAPPVAPTRPAFQRSWGVFAPLYAVREDDRAGHLGDVERLAAIIGRHGGRIVSVLPLLATYLHDDPFEYSPYQPVSRRYFSELYIDPDALPTGPLGIDLPPAPRGVDGLVDHRLLDHRAAAVVDHVRLALVDDHASRADFEQFVAEHGDAVDYARFRAAVERHGVRPDRLDGDPDRVDHHLVTQWLMDRQLTAVRDRLADKGQALALDLPVGCHPDGYDTHRRPDLYAPASTGAPPDEFFRGGQDWGFPPLHPTAARDDGHREFSDAVETLARHAGVVRIDHVLGLNRLWWVPPGGRADQGAYVRYPLDELLAVLRIVAHRHDTVIVGENLGTVPPEVTEALGRSGILGMHEEQFVIGDPPVDGLPAISPTTVAGINTHDMVPFAGFWQGVDLDDHADLGFRRPDDLPAARQEREDAVDRYRALAADELGHAVDDDVWSVLRAATERLAHSPAAQVMLTLEDLWGETLPQNVPGTHRERPNWRRPMARSLDEVESSPGADLLALLHEGRKPLADRPGNSIGRDTGGTT